jgi:Haem-binding domain
MTTTEKALWIVGGTLLCIFIVIQFFPIGWLVPSMELKNPPVQHTIEWSSPEAAELMQQTCYVCHSNETQLPLYAQIAPISWVASQNVNTARKSLNFSEQSFQEINVYRLIAYIGSDLMPPQSYRLMHPEANLTEHQKQILMDAIRVAASNPTSTAWTPNRAQHE